MEPVTIVKQSKQADGWKFTVAVGEQGDTTSHTVDLQESYYQQLTNGTLPPDELVIRSFEFLLAREPKTSILRKFNLQVIEDYFPDYPEKAQRWQSL
ncbi:MAG: hypothetical protein ACOX5R_14615 [bacterium]|jgi:hypothetical protein